jgi:hypothetical protein
MKLVGANPTPRLSGCEELPSKSHYFIGSDPSRWRSNVSHYAKVEYTAVYPGVDLVFYGNQRQLEFDFVIQPGSDASQIALEFEGAENLHLDAEGNLIIATGGGEVLFQQPQIYQEFEGMRRSVAGHFAADDNRRVSFVLDAYDRERPLIIDPVLSYSTYLGGTESDIAWAIAVDAEGNAIVVGNTGSPDFPGRNPTGAGAFVSKLSASGSLIFSSYFPASAEDVALDSAGNILLTGSVAGSQLAAFPQVNPIRPNPTASESSNRVNAYVTKLKPNGSDLLFSTLLGGTREDRGRAVAVDSRGNAYVTGSTMSTNFPVLNPLPGSANIHGPLEVHFGFPTPPLGAVYRDAFVSKFGPTGTLLYSTYLGAGNDDYGTGIAVDQDGAAYIVGQTASSQFPVTLNAFQTELRPPANGFLVKLSSAGNQMLYATYLGAKAAFEVRPKQLAFSFPALPNTQTKDLPVVLRNNTGTSVSIVQLSLSSTPSLTGYRFVDAPAVPFSIGPRQERTITIRCVDCWNTSHEGQGVVRAQFEGQSTTNLITFDLTGEAPTTNDIPAAATATDSFPPFNGPRAIALDQAGNTYLGGNSFGVDFPILGMLQPPIGEPFFSSAFAAKFSAALTLEYSIVLNGSAIGSRIAVDQSGSAYLAGGAFSTNFIQVQALQPALRGPADAFLAKLSPGGEPIVFSSFLGGNGSDNALGLALDAAGNAYLAGITLSPDFPVTNAFQPQYGSASKPSVGDAFVARIDFSVQQAHRFQVWQKLQLRGTFVSTSTNGVKVQFVRPVAGTEIVAEAPILQVTPSNVLVRVPVNLLGPSDVLSPPSGFDTNVTIRVITGFPQSPITNVFHSNVFYYPRPLIVDEVFQPPAIPAGLAPQIPTTLRSLLQFQVNNPTNLNDPASLATFVYLGRSTDGLLGLRTLNPSLAFPQPLRLEDGLTAFQPTLIPQSSPVAIFFDQMLPFTIFNLGFGNEGKQFNVTRNGLYVFVLEPGASSSGPFPAPFQIHLAGNVGLPRKLVNSVPEVPRGIRLDTLFNHPAPRAQVLAGQGANAAQTDLFKFANRVSVSQFAVAVLIPLASGGFPNGTPIVRSADPTVPLGIATPTARTPACFPPVLGTVIDFTQVPIPMEPDALAADVVLCATLGANDLLGPSLPLPIPGGAAVTSLILDMGSGQEIVDGTGPDFRVFALAGSYTVAVANTPFMDSFVPIAGTFSGTSAFDLAGTGLTSARYVRVTAAPTVVLDAVQALNVFADEMLQNQTGQGLGPFIRADRATITLRRAKAPVTPLDPFLQLIGPSGTLFAENESGFGDDLSQDLSDSALTNVALVPEFGFFRFLAKGYDKQPDSQAFGSFFTRLETAGNYDQVEIVVSNNDETRTAAQKSGAISTARQRDSYLFQATPGQLVNIVVNSKSLSAGAPALPNPVVELYDPEDFFIAANDDFPQRGRNAALSVTLPSVNFAGVALPNPSTYRIVVSGIDSFANTSPLAAGTAHIRSPAGGGYEVKVFTGALAGGTPVGAPRIDSINPSMAVAGTQLTISGANFSPTVTSNIVLFGSVQATVVSASSTQLVVVVPAGVPAGPVSVTIRVGGQTSVPVNFQVSVPVARTAAARLNCLSLRFLPAIVSFLGQNYTLALTSLADPSPPNGELFPQFDPLDFSHSSDFRLGAPNPADSINGSIFLDVPMASDVDRDGVADFFQISQGVGSPQTQGEYFTDTDDGTVTATWNRAAGSKTGACRLILRSTTLGQLADFTNTFELLEYSGPLTYTPGSSNVTGVVQFTQTLSTSNTLTGPILFMRSLTNRLNELQFSNGRWTNTVGRALSYNSGVLKRVSVSSSNYFGGWTFQDGDLVTTGADYFDWILAVRDTNDADGDGVPDLSDDPSSVSGPVFTRPRVEAGQLVLEWQGTGRLQSANEITGPWADVPGAMSPFRQMPVGTRQYFRIAP